jgi:hypothetical protein
MRRNIRVLAGLAAVICAAGVAHANTASPSRSELAGIVRGYLEDHGDLCVGKNTWPRYVTEADRRAGSNDAVQLPVLERLGLVESVVVTPAATRAKVDSGGAGQSAALGPIRRYSLTAKGRQFYLRKRRIVVGAHDRPVQQDADFCVARLSLDNVMKWSPPERMNGHLEAMAWYTYHIKSADWMTDPEARKVFPVVDRIIRGQGDLLMSVAVRLQHGRWVAVLPGQ